MEKISEILDDLIYYIYYKPIDIYKTIKYWFYCNWNIEHFRLVKQAFISYGWDYCFLTLLEEKQIDKLIKYLSKHKFVVEDQYRRKLWSLKIAKKLLHTINTNADDLWYSTGSLETKKNENGTYEILPGDLQFHYRGPRINKNNLHRFLSNAQLKNKFWTCGDFDNEVYLIKCKHLYYKLREHYTEDWWE